MNDYSKMSIKDLEKLKENLLNQISNLNNTIEEVVNNIRFKNTQASDDTLRLNPYYKDFLLSIQILLDIQYNYEVNYIL